MNTSISTTYRSASAPRQKQLRDPGSTVDADEVGLVNPQSGLVTQEDANQFFNDKIDTLEAEVSENDTDISALDAKVTVNESAITALDGRVTTNEGDITALDGRVTTLENVSVIDGGTY